MMLSDYLPIDMLDSSQTMKPSWKVHGKIKSYDDSFSCDDGKYFYGNNEIQITRKEYQDNLSKYERLHRKAKGKNLVYLYLIRPSEVPFPLNQDFQVWQSSFAYEDSSGTRTFTGEKAVKHKVV
jgi:hypothetical protein